MNEINNPEELLQQGLPHQQEPVDNTTFICDVEEILENSFFNKDSLNLGYVLTSIEPIKNEKTTNIYNECRKHLEKSVKSKGDLVERDLIYLVPDVSNLDTIKHNGCLTCLSEPSSLSIFATTSSGIHLHKHLDVLLRNEYKKRTTTVHCVLAKATIDLNRVCVAQPACVRPTSRQELPPPSYCHCLISNDLAEPSDEIEIQSAKSTVFIYGNNNQPPENILPFAVLKFQNEDPNFHDELIYAKKQTTAPQPPPLNDSFLSISFNDSDTTTTIADTTISLAAFQTTTDTSTVLARSADFKQTQFELISKSHQQQKPTPTKKEILLLEEAAISGRSSFASLSIKCLFPAT